MDTDEWLAVGAVATVACCCIFALVTALYRTRQRPVEFEDVLTESILVRK